MTLKQAYDPYGSFQDLGVLFVGPYMRTTIMKFGSTLGAPPLSWKLLYTYGDCNSMWQRAPIFSFIWSKEKCEHHPPGDDSDCHIGIYSLGKGSFEGSLGAFGEIRGSFVVDLLQA